MTKTYYSFLKPETIKYIVIYLIAIREGGMYKVYVVEDDVLIMEEVLRTVPWMDNGFEIIGYSYNPAEAIDEILKLVPDVVFSDLKMPGMDGNQMISELQERGAVCEFVMLSGYDSFEDTRNFFRQQGFDYLLKPLRQSEIQIVLERLSVKLFDKYGTPLALSEGMNAAFAELVSYVTENYGQKHSLEQLGQRFALSPNYICNLFAKHYHSTLTSFVTQKRMKEAGRLVRQQSIAFKEIAIQCGYGDYYYFCKVFKEHYGMSPTQYRQQGRE